MLHVPYPNGPAPNTNPKPPTQRHTCCYATPCHAMLSDAHQVCEDEVHDEPAKVGDPCVLKLQPWCKAQCRGHAPPLD